MRQVVSLAEARLAAEDLASRLLGTPVYKAVDPLSPEGFLLIGEKVAKRLQGAVKGGEAAVVAGVIHSLGFDWKKLSPDAATAAMNAVNKAITASYEKHVLPKIDDALEVEGPKVMTGTKKSLIVHQNIEIASSLNQRDLEAEKAIRKSQVNFIRDSTGERVAGLSKQARSMVSKGLEDGLSSAQISADLQGHFARSIPRPESYWRTVSDSFIGRARTTSQVYSYEEANIQTCEVVAVIDEVTTDQCRFMNGKVFTVSSIRTVLDSVSELENPEDVRFANPWIRKGKDPDGGGMRLFVPHANGETTTIAKIDRSGVGRADDPGAFSKGKDENELTKLGVPCPPFHGRCRTVLVAGAETTSTSQAPVMVPGADLEQPLPQSVENPAPDEETSGTSSPLEVTADPAHVQSIRSARESVASSPEEQQKWGGETSAAVAGAMGEDAGERARNWSSAWVNSGPSERRNAEVLEGMQREGSWVQGYYHATQANLESQMAGLKEVGIADASGHLTLYRGVTGDQAKVLRTGSIGDAVDLGVNGVSSWTSSLEVATKFANDHRDPGVVLSQRVHVSRVFGSHSGNAAGRNALWRQEREYALLAPEKTMAVKIHEFP